MISFRITILFLANFFAFLVHAQKYSPEVEARIKKVENNLCSWVLVEGLPNWNIHDRMKFYRANGVSIAVIKDFKIDWAKGYGLADTGQKRKVTPTTLFQAASNSKSLTAMGVMKLIQDGKIDPSADINTYLRSWKFPYDSVAKGKKITVENLLNHTAALSAPSSWGYALNDTLPTLVQILDGKKPAKNPAVRSVMEPGLKSQYSGGGYDIAQMIVEEVSGMLFAEYMQKNVLVPLGMTQSFFTQPPPAAKKNFLAAGYYETAKEVPGKYKIYPEMAAAGLWANPTDLAKYIIETQLSLARKSNKILSQQTTKHSLVPFDTAAAMGLFVVNKSGVQYFAHGGGNEGYICQFFGSMENGNGVVIMINNNNTGLLDEITNSVAMVYQWPNFYRPEINKEFKMPVDSLDKYTGMYKIGKNVFQIVKQENALFLMYGDYPCKLHFLDKENFFLFEAAHSYSKFKYDKEGTIWGFNFSGKTEAIRLKAKK